MPPLSPDNTAHACPTDEQLVLAHDHEHREMLRYRGLALSFLPTRPHVSRLMAALGIECERRLATLEELACHLELRDCLPTDSPRQRPQPDTHRLHLFIANQAMACQALGYALTAAHHSRQFSELLARFCHEPSLATVLGSFADQKHKECQLLQDAREGAYSAASPRG